MRHADELRSRVAAAIRDIAERVESGEIDLGTALQDFMAQLEDVQGLGYELDQDLPLVGEIPQSAEHVVAVLDPAGEVYELGSQIHLLVVDRGENTQGEFTIQALQKLPDGNLRVWATPNPEDTQ